MTITGTFTIRPATENDLEAILSLLSQENLDQIGEGNEVRNTWELADVVGNLEANSRVVLTPAGELIACGLIEEGRLHVRINSAVSVAPAYQGSGIGTALAEWAEARARELIPHAPEDARIVLLQEPLSSNTKAAELLKGRGYRWVRTFSRMVVEMDGPPPAPIVPAGLAIRPFLGSQETRALVAAFRDAFDDHWGHINHDIEASYQWWCRIMEHDPAVDTSLWFLAVEGDEIAGMSLSCAKLLEDPDMGYLWLLGVRRPWRKRGLGLALLHTTFGTFYARGQHKVSLSVDAESLTNAKALYERGGMRVLREYDYYEKELRPGKELSRQTL